MLEELAETTGGFYLRLEGAQTMEVLYKMDSRRCQNRRILAPW